MAESELWKENGKERNRAVNRSASGKAEEGNPIIYRMCRRENWRKHQTKLQEWKTRKRENNWKTLQIQMEKQVENAT